MKLEDGSSIGNVDMLIDNVDMTQFVNPQDTDKRYGRSQIDCTYLTLRTPNAYVNPATSKFGSDCRRPSLTISETRSSESSFDSSSGRMTPCTPMSASSGSSSRRHSMITPGNQQYYLSPSSPCPMSRSSRSKQVTNQDPYSLHQPFAPEVAVDCSQVTSFATESGASYGLDEEFPMTMNDFADGVHADWLGEQTNNDFVSMCEHAMHATDTSASLSMDLARNFSYAMTARTKDSAHQYVHGSQTQIIDDIIPAQEVGPSQAAVASNPSVRSLDPPFVYVGNRCELDEDLVDEDAVSNAGMCVRSPFRKSPVKKRKSTYVRIDQHNGLPSPPSLFSEPACKGIATPRANKNRKAAKKSGRLQIDLIVSSENKKHPCPFCDYKFVRPEHLARHKKSKHDRNTKYYPCLVHDCKDRDGNHKMIKARGDNLAPHYINTHFSFGNSDKSGKNRRISLKESLEIGLLEWDHRWANFLEGRINLDSENKGEWKMLGYSIRETRDTRIKDIIPGWEGPDDATLKQFDFRWQMLQDRSMDFETAMAGGYKMVESERRDKGLLGVTMLESEEMGLKGEDPRWENLLSGKMTIGESEILGVKHLNPTWLALQTKRRR